MKIALVSEHASPLATLGGVDAGGQNVYVAELACALGERGHRVLVYTRRDCRSLPVHVPIAPNVEVVHVDAGPPESLSKDALFPYMEQFGAELVRAWRRERPDVAHSHFWMSGVATQIAARRYDVPWIHTYHALGAEKRREQGHADTSPAERIACEREILREADAIVATSSAEIFEHRRTGGGRDLKLIACGVALEHFDERSVGDWPRRLRYRIATLSRLVPRKGVGDVVRALASVPDTELVVAGGGEAAEFESDPEVVRLHRLASASGVADRVHFAGPLARTQVAGFLRSADVVVCAPRYEPFGLVPLEAMACARPVVVSSVGGLIDTVVDGVTGLHVPVGDPEELARALGRLLPDARLRAHLGTAGRRRVERRYTWSAIAERTESVYVAHAERLMHARETIA